MKYRNVLLLVLFALLIITPVLAVAPTSNFYLVPTDMKVYSMVPYDAMVYQDGTYTIAVNRTGGIINATPISASQDDIPIQAAVTYGNRVYIQGGHSYNIASKITVHTGSFIEGDGIKTALWALMNDDMFYGSATNEVTFRDIYINMNNKNGNGIHLTGTTSNNFGHLLDDFVVIGSNYNGVLIENAQTIRVSNSIFEANIISGLNLHSSGSVFVLNTLAEGNGAGIYFNQSSMSTVQSGEFNSNTGIKLDGSQQIMISGIQVSGGGNVTGVSLDATSFRNTVTGSSLYIYGPNTFGINSLGYQNIFVGNNIQGLDNSAGNRLIKGIVSSTTDKIIGNSFDFCSEAIDSGNDNIVSGNSVLNSQYGLVNVGTNIFISTNRFDTVGTPLTNYGTIAGEGAAASIADGGTISHNLGYTPNWCLGNPTVSNTTVSTGAISSSTFQVAIKNAITGAPGTTQTIVWRCGL